jgi:hypothetical protein
VIDLQRRKLSRRRSRRMFRRAIVRTDRRNLQVVPMRGGFRI